MTNRAERRQQYKAQKRSENKKQRMRKSTKKLIKIAVLLGIIALVGILVLQFASPTPYDEQTTQRPSFGPQDARVVVTKYTDFQCPACKAAHQTLLLLKDQFGDQVKFEVRHFPLTAIHPFAFDTANAVECAQDLGFFWEYIDVIYENQPQFTRPDLIRYGEQVGIPAEEFRACIASGAKRKYVNEDMAQGRRMAITGTPSFFVNNLPVASSPAELQRTISGALGMPNTVGADSMQ